MVWHYNVFHLALRKWGQNQLQSNGNVTTSFSKDPHSISWGMNCRMPQHLFSHQLEGGSQAPLGKEATISIQNTHRRGNAEIRNKQNSCFLYCIWDEKTGLSQRLIWGSSKSDLRKCHLWLAAACPQCLLSQTQYLHGLLTSPSVQGKICLFIRAWQNQYISRQLKVSKSYPAYSLLGTSLGKQWIYTFH